VCPVRAAIEKRRRETIRVDDVEHGDKFGLGGATRSAVAPAER